METRRTAVSGITGLLILFAFGSLSGQGIVDVRKGDEVRITYGSNGSKTVVGLLHDVSDSAFLVSPSTNRVVPIPRDQVTEFRVLRGQEREWKKGLLYGSLMGAVSGALFYLALEEGVEEVFGGTVESSEPGPLVYGLVGALYGGGIGAGIGWFFKKDRWDPVDFGNTFPPSLGSPIGRVSFGFSVTVRKR